MSKGLIVFKLSEFPHISETFIINQIRTAIDLGYQVKILISKLLPEEKRSKSKIIDDYRLLEQIIFEDYKIPKNKIIRVLKWFSLLFFNLPNLKNVILFHSFKAKFSLTWMFIFDFFWRLKYVNLFHVQYGTNHGSFPELKAAGFKPKLLCQFHGHDAFFPINGFIENNGYYDLMFTKFNAIITNTKFLTNQLIKIGCESKKIFEIPVSVDTEFFVPKKMIRNKEKIELVTIGRLSPIKGHKYLIELMELLKNRDLNVHLTIIGGGFEEVQLIKEIHKRHLNKFIKLTGFLSHDLILKHLHRSDVFVFTPLTQSSGWGETQGLAISEAMSCGLPVITFNVGGVKYTFQHNISGFLIPEFDLKEMVEKVELLKKNHDLRYQMGRSAEIFVKDNFSKKVIDEKWNKVYTELIE